MEEKTITWGVDGHGYRHFICKKCGKFLGKSKTKYWFDYRCDCEDSTKKSKKEINNGI